MIHPKRRVLFGIVFVLRRGSSASEVAEVEESLAFEGLSSAPPMRLRPCFGECAGAVHTICTSCLLSHGCSACLCPHWHRFYSAGHLPLSLSLSLLRSLSLSLSPSLSCSAPDGSKLGAERSGPKRLKFGAEAARYAFFHFLVWGCVCFWCF